MSSPTTTPGCPNCGSHNIADIQVQSDGSCKTFCLDCETYSMADNPNNQEDTMSVNNNKEERNRMLDNERHQKKRTEYEARQAARKFYGNVGMWTLHWTGDSSNPYTRIAMKNGIGIHGLLKMMIQEASASGRRKEIDGRVPTPWERLCASVAVPLIHLRTEDDEEIAEDHGKLEVPMTLVREARNSVVHPRKGTRTRPFAIVKGKHAFDLALLPILNRAFPKAIDMRAYLSGLAAPAVGNGFCETVEIMVTQIPSYTRGKKKSSRKVIPRGSDGCGLIHTKHWLWHKLGISGGDCGSIQIRWIEIETGRFCKGILVADDRALDHDGNPAIWMDKSQVKGRYKNRKETKSLKIGEFQSYSGSMTVINKWQKSFKDDRTSWGYQIIENMTATSASRTTIGLHIDRWIKKFKEDGAEEAILNRLCDTDMLTKFNVDLCRRLDLDPMSIPAIAASVEMELGKACYRVVQGGGIKSPTYTIVIDDGLKDKEVVLREEKVKEVFEEAVPEGEVDIADLLGKCIERYTLDPDYPAKAKLTPDGKKVVITRWKVHNRIGSEVFITRYPCIQTQMIVIGKIVEPLEHMLISNGRGNTAPPNRVVFMNSTMATHWLMGDDDGDRVLVDDRWDIVAMAKASVARPHGPDATYLIEPKSQDNDVRSKILMYQYPWLCNGCGATIKAKGMNVLRYPLDECPSCKHPVMKAITARKVPNQEALDLIAIDGRGPIGILTVYRAAFMSLGMRMHALAMSVMIQLAIDSAKRVVVQLDPSLLIRPENWYECNPEDTEERVPGSNFWTVDIERCQADKSWYEVIPDGKGGLMETGHIDTSAVQEWVGKEWESHCGRKQKLKDLIPWRMSNKSVMYKAWNYTPPVYGGNLVNDCAEMANSKLSALGWRSAPEDSTSACEVLLKALDTEGVRLSNGKRVSSLKPLDGTELYKLRDRAGFNSFGRAMRTTISGAYEGEEKRKRVDAAYGRLIQGLNKLSIDELLMIWVSELSFTNKPNLKKKEKQQQTSRVNRAFRAICWPGSPILKALGMDVPEPCKFMSDDAAKATHRYVKKQLNSRIANGEAVTFAGVMYDCMHEAKKHERVTGVKLTECITCMSVINGIVGDELCEDKKGADEYEIIVTPITHINSALKRDWINKGRGQ